MAIGLGLASACTAPGMKKLKSSTIRRHPLRRASGESATTSVGASRAWKSKARRYSGSLVRMGLVAHGRRARDQPTYIQIGGVPGWFDWR
jgi:hypothetical protein